MGRLPHISFNCTRAGPGFPLQFYLRLAQFVSLRWLPAVASSANKLLAKRCVKFPLQSLARVYPIAIIFILTHRFYISGWSSVHAIYSLTTAERPMHNGWGASRTFLSIARVRDRAFRCNFLRKRSERRLTVEHEQDREEGVSSVKARPRL